MRFAQEAQVMPLISSSTPSVDVVLICSSFAGNGSCELVAGLFNGGRDGGLVDRLGAGDRHRTGLEDDVDALDA